MSPRGLSIDELSNPFTKHFIGTRYMSITELDILSYGTHFLFFWTETLGGKASYKHIMIQLGKVKLSPGGNRSPREVIWGIGRDQRGRRQLRAQNEGFLWRKQEGAFQALWLRKVGSRLGSRKCCSRTNLESASGKKRGSNGTRSRNLIFSIWGETSEISRSER